MLDDLFGFLHRLKDFPLIGKEVHIDGAIALAFLKSYSQGVVLHGKILMDDIVGKPCEGGIFVVDLSKALPQTRRIVVEYLLSKLSSLLRSGAIDPLFLLAEEAHLYLRETYWDDLITRMRHIGLFPIFVTNQPDSIPETVYRQADNIFLFNFTNESDLNYISKASRIDADTVKKIAKMLPPRYCLVIGKVVNDLPIVVRVRDLELKTMGETKLLFKADASCNRGQNPSM